MSQLETIRSHPIGGQSGGIAFDLRQVLGKLCDAPRLIGGDDIGIDEQWLILDSFYDFKPMISATVAVFLACWVVWIKGLPVEAGLWVLSSLIVLVARFILSRAYASRSPSASVRTWTGRYYLAVIVTGFQWGLGGLAIAHTHDGTTLSAIFGVETALMAGASSRGYTFPAAALVQVNLTAMMIAVFSFFAEQYVFFFLMLLYSLHQSAFVISLTKIKLKAIDSERQRHALLLTLAQTNEELAAANARLHDMSTTDALTGIANRRGFDRELPLRWTQAFEKRTALSLLLVDVDHFKGFNDAYGHPAGDKCLALVAAAMKSVVRYSMDHAARYGGEEFALILPDSDRDSAGAVAERLMAAVRSIAVPVSASQSVGVTVSVGIGSLRPDGTMDETQLISMADQALYRAKQEGRDRVR